MSKNFTLRLLDTFFRRKWLYLLPLMFLVGVGLLNAATMERSYRSTGTLYVERETFLASLTAVRGGEVGWDTPARHYNTKLAALLQTDAFIEEVADSAGVDAGDYASQGEMLFEVRQAIVSWPAGTNLLRVAVDHPDAQTAHRLAQSVVDTFTQWQIDADVSESSAAEQFLSELIVQYEREVAFARDLLDDYLAETEPVADQQRTLAEQIQIDRLTADVALAESRLFTALGKEEEARLATAQTEGNVRQQVRFVDLPAVPAAPEPILRHAAQQLVVFAVIGSILSMAALAVATALDRSVSNESDVRDRLNAGLLGSVPEVAPGSTSRSSRGDDEPSLLLPVGGLAGTALEVELESGELWHRTPAAVASTLRHIVSRWQVEEKSGVTASLGITSTLTGEGVTTLSRSFASILAHDLESSVCLVETNWWSPSELGARPGLSDVSWGNASLDDALVSTSLPGLSILPSGSVGPEERSILVQSLELRDSIHELREEFDHVVLDLPALRLCGEALALTDLGDACLLVIRHGVTTIEQAHSSLEDLSYIPTVGVVLNRVSSRVPRVLLDRVATW
jgi:Mrp family chromosome partitioning ATPase/capsular polysaccharide biosynthesis protein